MLVFKKSFREAKIVRYIMERNKNKTVNSLNP
jgi:hypothetical protein